METILSKHYRCKSHTITALLFIVLSMYFFLIWYYLLHLIVSLKKCQQRIMITHTWWCTDKFCCCDNLHCLKERKGGLLQIQLKTDHKFFTVEFWQASLSMCKHATKADNPPPKKCQFKWKRKKDVRFRKSILQHHDGFFVVLFFLM